MVNRATLETRRAALSTEFGLNYATKLFGEEALADLPRYTKGKNIGQLKGYVIWVRCTNRGGWSPYGVAYPNSTVRAWVAPYEFSGETQAYSGNWLGRVQNICGSVCVLGEANRAKVIAERAREEAERQATWEQIKHEQV